MWEIIKGIFRKYFFTGLFVVVPLALTIIILKSIIFWMDSLIPTPIWGLGIIITVVLIILVGVFTTNIFGKKLLSIWERILSKIPLFSNIYMSIKQMMEAIFGAEKKGFSKVILFEYPRKGLYTLGLVTGETGGKLQDITDEEVMNVFVPTTPNPTSGWYILVPKNDAIEMDISVEDAFKIIISGGIVTPWGNQKK